MAVQKTEIKKDGKGHNVYVNNNWAFWVIGSKKNAEKELQIYLRS
jgi:hypothetical protein